MVLVLLALVMLPVVWCYFRRRAAQDRTGEGEKQNILSIGDSLSFINALSEAIFARGLLCRAVSKAIMIESTLLMAFQSNS